jgi:hypothetical protein
VLALGLTAMASLPTLGSAQSNRAVPSIYASVEGNDLASYPFGRTGFRMQQCVAGSAIANTTAILSAVSYRADNDNSTSKPALVLTTLQVAVGATSMSPASMSTTFGANITGTMTQVYNGALALPAYTSTSGGVAPWIPITFSAPFPYTVASGNLLIDMTVPVSPSASSGYTIDSALPGGTYSTFGTPGPLSKADFVSISISGNGTQGRFSGIVPGGSLTMIVQSQFFSWSGALFLGAAKQASPVDLSVIGAPGNFLYIQPLVSLPITLTSSISGFRATLPLSIPGGPVTGGQLMSQAAVIDPPVNSLGLMTTSANVITIGDPLPHPVQQLQSSDSAALTGAFQYGTSNLLGGAVLRFSGTIL